MIYVKCGDLTLYSFNIKGLRNLIGEFQALRAATQAKQALGAAGPNLIHHPQCAANATG
jgi:hypothetical protein